MARVSMKDRAAGITSVAAPEPSGPVTPAPAASKPAPVVKVAGAEDARINFAIDRELRQRFKVWAAANDTTIKDELTRHIEELLG